MILLEDKNCVIVLAIFAAVLAVLIGAVPTFAVHAQTAPAGTNSTGLGLSIDAVKTDYLDLSELKDGAYVFDPDWLDQKVQEVSYVVTNESDSYSIAESSFYELSKTYNSKLGFDSSVSGGVDLFSGGLSFGFKANSTQNYNEYTNQYFGTSYLSYRLVHSYDDDTDYTNESLMTEENFEELGNLLNVDRIDRAYYYSGSIQQTPGDSAAQNTNVFIEIDESLPNDYGFELYGRIPQNDSEVVITELLFNHFKHEGYYEFDENFQAELWKSERVKI